jgi:hypothetical protein
VPVLRLLPGTTAFLARSRKKDRKPGKKRERLLCHKTNRRQVYTGDQAFLEFVPVVGLLLRDRFFYFYNNIVGLTRLSGRINEDVAQQMVHCRMLGMAGYDDPAQKRASFTCIKRIHRRFGRYPRDS